MFLLRLLLALLAAQPSPAPATAPGRAAAQSPEVLNCATDEMHEALRKSDADYALKMDELEAEWTKTQKEDRPKSALPPPYVLPIVFHIVHENGAENIPDSDIFRSVDYLNQALENTDYFDPATGVNTRIQVCLAGRSPDNEPTNGINRIVSPLTNLSTNDDRDMKDLSRWAPRDYVNVWVVKEACGLGLGCGLAGYAFYPGAHGSRIDGIVMEARWLADDEADLTVLVHELGHYLGVRHTFDGGCENDDCLTDGDRVCDTPPDQSTVAIPCTGSANSCSTDVNSGPFATDQNDMHTNYMDYGYFRCYSAFTAGQRERMHFFLEGTRRSLLDSKGCLEPCPAVVTGGFTGGDVTVTAGTTIDFVNTSTNGQRYEWYRGSTLISTDENLSYTFDEEGSFRIRLIVFPADSLLCDAVEVPTQRVMVICEISPGFDLPTPAPVVDSAVVFTNTSAGGDESEWTVDGSVVSTVRDLNYIFTAAGRYRVCLTETVGLCEDERCVTVFVREPVTDPDLDDDEPPVDTIGCDGRFAYSYSLPDSQQDGWFSAVVARGDTIYTLARQDQRPYVMAINADGSILWQLELFPSGNNTIPNRLIIDSEGMLAGLISTDQMSTSGIQNVRPMAFRIEPVSGALLWAREFEVENETFFTAIIDPGFDNNYRISGRSGGVSFLAVIDRDNGMLAMPAQRVINPSSLRVRNIAYRSSLVGGTILMAGNSDQGIALMGASENGSVIQSTIVTSTEPNGTIGNFENAFLLNDGDSLLIGSNYKNFTTNVPTMRICKTNAIGIPFWTIDYRTSSLFMRLCSIKKNEEGYLLLLNLGNDAGLVQTDFNGEVLWAKRYDDFSILYSTADALTIADNHILVAGFVLPSDAVPTVLRLSKDGTAAGSCTPTTNLEVNTERVDNSDAEYQVSNASFQFGAEEIGAEPANFMLVEELICREDCPEEEEECFRHFVRTYDTAPDQPQAGLPTVNLHVQHGGNTIIAGRIPGGDKFQPFVSAIRPDGEVLWTRKLFENQAGVVLDMIIDQEGMLCGVGNGAIRISDPSTYAFRLNPDTGDFLWFKRYRRQGRAFLLTELHHTAGDGFLRAAGSREADPLTAISNGLVARIDLATGDIQAPPITYSDLGETTFRAFGKHPASSTYYALANIQQSSAGTPQLARLTANGTVIFNKQFDTPEIGQAVDMVVADSTVTMLCQLNGEDGFVVLQTDAEGNVLWQKNYSGGASAYAIESAPSGFIVSSFYGPFLGSLTLIAGRNGNVIWSSLLPNDYTFGTTDAGLHVTTSATGMTVSTNAPFGSDHGLTIVRSDYSGAFNTGCEFPANSIGVTQTESQTIVADIPLELGEVSFSTENLEASNGFLELQDNCTSDCREPVEICDNGLDDDFDGLADCDDPDLVENCCCLDPPQVVFGTDQTFCGDTRIVFFTAESWDFVRLSGDASSFIGDPEAGFPYAYLFDEPGTYILTATDTCGNTGADTLVLTPVTPPVLELGPDLTVCKNATVALRAQPGFESYEWIDGSTEETFTTFGEGDFSVVVTDSCGNQQTDVVTITFDPETVIDLGPDLTICPGDTLTFRIEGYTDIQWSQSTFIDCSDCEEVRFAPTVDTLLLVAAMSGPGCFSSDSIRVRIKSLTGRRDSVFLCRGDTLLFGDQAITAPGRYLAAIDESLCPVIDTVDVFGLPDTLLSREISICAGDSVLLYGSFERVSGVYASVGTRANGCDSANQVVLTVKQAVATAETISICAGDSALVFGVFERDPDLYERTQTGANGCDSTHRITLEVNDVSATAVQVRPDCEGAAAGAAEVSIESNGRPVTILWSEGTASALNQNLAAGDYSVTVTTADGCSASATVTISTAPLTVIAPASAPETCPGENDGRITIPSAPAGFTYRLDDGPAQALPRFENLAPGAYRLTASDSLGCPQTFELSVAAAEELVFELPADLTIPFGDSVVLAPSVLNPANVTISWLTENGAGCRSCPDFTLRPAENVTVTAVATDMSGCSLTSSVRITVDERELFYLPNAFSPNGDGVNDLFRLYPGPAVETILSLAVYDRWGGQVFLRENVDPADVLGHWDGRVTGSRDPSVGVYVYLVRVRLFDGEVVTRGGEVLVMR